MNVIRLDNGDYINLQYVEKIDTRVLKPIRDIRSYPLYCINFIYSIQKDIKVSYSTKVEDDWKDIIARIEVITAR